MMFHNRSYDPFGETPGDSLVSAEDASFHADNRVDQIQHNVERLLLITEALWSLLKEKHEYEDEELVKRVLEIDARDGQIDGKVAAAPPTNCPHCDRPTSKNRRYCIYCGEPMPVDLFQR
jgi:hypothetical protein